MDDPLAVKFLLGGMMQNMQTNQPLKEFLMFHFCHIDPIREALRGRWDVSVA